MFDRIRKLIKKKSVTQPTQIDNASQKIFDIQQFLESQMEKSKNKMEKEPQNPKVHTEFNVYQNILNKIKA